MDDDYSNFPKSITEIKSDKDDDANVWTIRDTLIAALRDYDAGEFPEAVCVAIIVGSRNEKRQVKTYMYQKSRDDFELYGMIEVAKENILKGR